jgi:predicted CXXCH cytochrome family protein
VKKISFILLAVALLAVLMSGTALANFGPHGGYVQDTDACAGCHRAHTAFSSLTWNTVGSPSTTKSALLVSSASTMSQFCYACHGDGAPGASTNVQSGKFDAGPSASSTETVGTSPHGTTLLYKTDSSFDATLNGGGFEKIGGSGATVSSSHQIELGGSTAPMWGNGSALPAAQNLTCTDCHDPHGSSNYRLLKDTLSSPAGAAVVGGYDASDTPSPFVISAETGYPATGWLKHADGAMQVAGYVPNYTKYLYKVNTGGDTSNGSFSQWCAGCHTQYNKKTSAYNYLTTIAGGNAAAANTTYHRHPVDTSLMSGDPNQANPPAGQLAFPTPMLIDPGLPLEVSGSSGNPYADYLTCLTCHYAHGTEATMSGWAAGGITTATALPFQDASLQGVQPFSPATPIGTSALLRYNNRGVCERCHNK